MYNVKMWEWIGSSWHGVRLCCKVRENSEFGDIWKGPVLLYSAIDAFFFSSSFSLSVAYANVKKFRNGLEKPSSPALALQAGGRFALGGGRDSCKTIRQLAAIISTIGHGSSKRSTLGGLAPSPSPLGYS